MLVEAAKRVAARGSQDLDAGLGAGLGADEVLLGAVVEDEFQFAPAQAAQHERHEELGQCGESVAGRLGHSEVSSSGGGAGGM